MNFFPFKRNEKPAPAASFAVTGKLPAVNSFVDVCFKGGLKRQSVAVNEIDGSTLVTRRPIGLEAGMEVDFLYSTPGGRFRFWATCTGVDESNAAFALPTTVKTLASFVARGAARIDKVVPAQWRFAPGGTEGYGEFMPGSMSDLSLGGASLVVARELKVKHFVEVQFTLDPTKKKYVEFCEVMRAVKIEQSAHYCAGIRFLAMNAEDQRALANFLHDLVATRRDRGLV